MQRVERSVFGELNGKPIHLFRLSNANGMVAELLEFGGRIKALCIPDGQGGLDNMSVGYDTFEPYHARFNPWLGALLGRTASRVTGARFQIDGKTYNLSASGPAGSNMHGGFVGFDSRVWTGEADSDATSATLKLTYLSPDGEEGYPGNASVTVTYRLDDDNRFHMDWEAVTDAPCELSRNMRIYVTRNENVPRHFFALAHFLSAFFGGAWRRVKTDTIHPLFLRKWGRFHRHQEYSLGLLRFPPAFYGLLRQATWLYTHYRGYTPCFWTTSFDSFFAASAAVSLSRLMS